VEYLEVFRAYELLTEEREEYKSARATRKGQVPKTHGDWSPGGTPRPVPPPKMEPRNRDNLGTARFNEYGELPGDELHSDAEKLKEREELFRSTMKQVEEDKKSERRPYDWAKSTWNRRHL
jgi:hypothetical protein